MRYDGKTGLMDMNARWYDPNAGRFMSEDTYPGERNDPQSLNRYAYVMNNPVNMWDPTGHVAEYVDGGSTTLPDGFSGIPSWVRAELDYDYGEKISDNVSYFHYWDHRYTDPYKSDTRLVDTIDETRFYRQIYEQDFSTTWYYDYLKIQVIGEFPRNYWESSETFQESYTKRWEEILTAEEVANQNQEDIAKLGAPPNAKIIGYKVNISNAFSSYVEREKERHLKQIKPPSPEEPNIRISPSTYGYDYQITFESKRRVLGGYGDHPDPGALGYIVAGSADFLILDDIRTLTDPSHASNEEIALAVAGLLSKPIKFADKAVDITKKVDIDEILKSTGKDTGKADFYVTPSGDAVPSTGYRYMSKDASKTKVIPENSNGTYFSFNKFDSPAPGKLQVPHDASIRGSFDTLQIIDDIRIPNGNWGKANYLEPLTKDFPEYGPGGATQAITNLQIKLDRINKLP